MSEKAIGILGGMGPLAAADLFYKIVLLTDADEDTAHVRVYMDNNTTVPDRTEALLHGGPDPVPAMADSVRKLELCGADCLIIPCNTAHCFLPRLQALTKIPFLSMPREAALACRDRFPGKWAAVLATDGTIQSGLYQNALTEVGVPFIIPNETEQAAVMRVAYQGIKAGRGPEAYRKDWEMVVKNLRRRGADYFVLGCTELPLAAQAAGLDAPSLDPTAALAAAAIRFCGKSVRKDAAL